MSINDLIRKSAMPRRNITATLPARDMDELDALLKNFGIARKEFAADCVRTGLDTLRTAAEERGA